MIAFVISFVLSLAFMNEANKTRRRFALMLCHSLAILPPVFLLTFRAEECGTDTTNYTTMYNLVSADNFVRYIAETRLEMLFAFLMFGIKKLGLTIQYLFFMCGLLTIVPVYYGCFKLKDRLNPLFPMALFYLMFYQYSFNILRQSIAMSFVFLAVVFLIENKGRKALILGFVAVLFHTVAFVYFIVYLAYLLMRMNFIKGVVISAIISVVLLYVIQILYMNKVDAFYNYLEEGESSMESSYFVEMVGNYLIVLLVWEKSLLELRKFFLFVSGLVAVIIILSSVAPYFFRIANCLDILLLIYIPLALKSTRQKYLDVLYMSFAVFYWWFIFIFNGSGRSYPYIISPVFNLFG